jgi:hypothetical protein
MDEPLNHRPVSRAFEVVIGSVIGVAGIALVMFSGWLLTLVVIADFSQLRSPFAAGFTLSFSIGLVFAVVAWRLFFRNASCNAELMSIAGWRNLAWVLFATAIASSVLLHWVSALPPLVIAGICLLKDPKVAQWLLLFP